MKKKVRIFRDELLKQWKNIDFTSRPDGQTKDAFGDTQVSFFAEIALARYRNLVILDPEYQKNFFKNCANQSPFSLWLHSWRWTDITFLWVPELIFKAVGTFFISAYSQTRDKHEKATGFKRAGWLVATLFTGLANALVGQTCYFFGNVASDAQTLFDGALNFFVGLIGITPWLYQNKSTTDNPLEKPGFCKTYARIVGSSLNAIVKGVLFLIADLIVGGACYCISVATHGAAAPYLAPVPSTVQSVIAAPLSNVGYIIVNAVKGAILNGISKIVQFYGRWRSRKKEDKDEVQENSNSSSISVFSLLYRDLKPDVKPQDQNGKKLTAKEAVSKSSQSISNPPQPNRHSKAKNLAATAQQESFKGLNKHRLFSLDSQRSSSQGRSCTQRIK